MKDSLDPTVRTLRMLRGLVGWRLVERVEYHIGRGRTADLLGVIDVLSAGNGVVAGWQATSKSNMAARRKKILASQKARDFVDAGCKLYIIGWADNETQPTVEQISSSAFILGEMNA